MLKRKEVIRQLACQGCFPGKWGFRYVIERVRDFEAWQRSGRKAA